MTLVIEHRRLPPTRGELSRERHAERQNATPPKPKRRHSRLIGLAPRGTVVTNLTVGGSRCRTGADVETEADCAADARAREKLVPEVVYVPPERVEQQVTPAPAPADNNGPVSGAPHSSPVTAEEIEVVVRALLRGPLPAKPKTAAEACGLAPDRAGRIVHDLCSHGVIVKAYVLSPHAASRFALAVPKGKPRTADKPPAGLQVPETPSPSPAGFPEPGKLVVRTRTRRTQAANPSGEPAN